MRRPTRTRRLSIAGILSLVAFASVVAIGSLSNRDEGLFFGGTSPSIGLKYGHVMFEGLISTDYAKRPIRFEYAFGGFYTERFGSASGHDVFRVNVPLWFPLVLLLIVPLSWLIARPANTPAFSVIIDAKQV